MELWVIEAPGKARQLEQILRSMGIEARVQATKGHLFTMPDRLDPLGIDAAMHEYARVLRDPEVGRRVREEAAAADRIVVATDADAEGDVIAWDVAVLTADLHADPVRVRLRALDPESIREAIGEAGPVRREDAVPGRTRAIIDRMIGARFSAGGIPVGRVSTALLGAVAARAPSVHRLRLVAPAEGGGRPWIAETDVRAPLDLAAAERLAALDLPALPMKDSRKDVRTAPGHTGDIMVRAADRLDLSPAETARSMQRSYEAGKLSYPRAGSRGMSGAAIARIRRICEKAGYKFDSAAPPPKPETAVHDAPHPVGHVDLSLDPRKLGADEGVRTMIARDLVRSGQRKEVQTAAAAVLEKFLLGRGFPADVARHVAGLDWRREMGPRAPGQESVWPDPGVVTRRPDAVLLETAVELGLGRASTWANHIETFMARGLVDDQLRLTSKGREWAAASPRELLDPRVSAAIEEACERGMAYLRGDASGREPWEALAERIVRSLPPGLSGPLREAAEATPPQPRRDPLADFAPPEDVLAKAAELASERAAAYAPRSAE